jgi:glycosyltransferase involved in cell wall biosynthesis
LEALASGLPIAAFPVSGPLDVIGDAPVGVLDQDLRAACLAALNIPRGICVEFAAKHTWEASGLAFLDNMAPIRHADVPDEAIDLATDHPRFVT